MATTTVPVRREMLKNIGNVPDWVLKQQRVKDTKKDTVAKPIRRVAPKPKAVSTPQAAPTVKPPVVTPQPITEEVKDPVEHSVQCPPAGSKVRRIYSREFLVKFKYSASPFPPGAVTPMDLIAQYNKDFEIRERLAHESSSAKATTTTTTASVASSSPSPSTSVAAINYQHALSSNMPRPQATDASITIAPEGGEKRAKRIKTSEGEKKTTSFKLRGLGATDESILRSPLFRASASKLPSSSTKRAASPSPFILNDDKENPSAAAVPIKAARSTSAAKRQVASPLVRGEAPIKTQKLPTTSTPTAAAVVSTPTAPTPAPAPVAAPAPTPAATVAPEVVKTLDGVVAEVAMEDAKQDTVDVLTQKLKAVLKETDPRRLAQRQKQIEYGKATLGYKDYAKQIAKSKRKREDPKTPNKYQVCSKRSWDGQIRKWRRMLHLYDPLELEGAQAPATNPDMEGDDARPSFEITAADILAEEAALRE